MQGNMDRRSGKIYARASLLCYLRNFYLLERIVKTRDTTRFRELVT